MLKVFKIVKQFRKETVIFSIITSLVVPGVLFFHDSGTFIPFTVFYFVITTSLWISGINRAGIYNLTLIFSLIFGIYSLYLITVLSEEKITENLKIQAVSFSTENDPEAEHLLLDLWPVLTNDTTLASMMDVDYFNKIDFDRISGYLQEKYFTG
jgi:hypothetical protein